MGGYRRVGRGLSARRRWNFLTAFPWTDIFGGASAAVSSPLLSGTAFSSPLHHRESARKATGVVCRFHDLRHTFISRLAESKASDSTTMALAGHVSRAMMVNVEKLTVSPQNPQSGLQLPSLHLLVC
jgi:integrase